MTNTPALLRALMQSISREWEYGYVDCIKVSDIEERVPYSKQSTKGKVEFKGSFYKTNGINTLNTKFPLKVNMVHVLASVIATLQFVQDQCRSNDEDLRILSNTFENIFNVYNDNANIFRNVISTVSVPREAYAEALEKISYNKPLSAKISLDDDIIDNIILEKSARDLARDLINDTLYSTIKTYMLFKNVEEVPRDRLFKNIYLELIAAFIHYIDRKAFLFLTTDDRSYFMDTLMVSSIENYIDKCYSKILEEEEIIQIKDTATERINNLMLYYERFKKIMTSENDNDYEIFDTLIWNIGRNIASLEDYQDDINKVFGFIKIFIEHLSYLKIEEVLNDINQ